VPTIVPLGQFSGFEAPPQALARRPHRGNRYTSARSGHSDSNAHTGAFRSLRSPCVSADFQTWPKPGQALSDHESKLLHKSINIHCARLLVVGSFEGTRPAMAAKVTERLWEIGDIVGVLEAWEAAQVRRSIWEEDHGMV
jgi:hypothetical protein